MGSVFKGKSKWRPPLFPPVFNLRDEPYVALGPWPKTQVDRAGVRVRPAVFNPSSAHVLREAEPSFTDSKQGVFFNLASN